MAHTGVIGHDRRGPVAESVDARAVHRSLSWFKSRPGLQPSRLAPLRLGEPANQTWIAKSVPTPACRAVARRAKAGNRDKMPVDWGFNTLSRLRNLV